MANELDATQGEPEGGTAAIPGNETAPEQNENEQHDNTNETDASAEGSAEHNAQGEGEGGEEGASEGEQPDADKGKKPKKPLSWEMKRIHEETNKRREAERRAQELEEQLQKLRSGNQPDEPTTEPVQDIDALVDKRAQERLQQQEFSKRVSSFDASGASEFGREEFDQSCNLVATILDPRDVHGFMDALTDPEIVPDGHKVIMELANDPEEAERILRLPPVKRTVALVKLSERLSQPAKTPPKPISKAPAPVAPVGGNTKPASVLNNPEASQEEFDRELKKMLFAKKR